MDSFSFHMNPLPQVHRWSSRKASQMETLGSLEIFSSPVAPSDVWIQ